MASKRILKSNIHEICSKLFTECIAASFNIPKESNDNIGSLVFYISEMEKNFVKRINHIQPGMKPQAYFKDLIEKFNSQAIEIIDQIYNLH